MDPTKVEKKIKEAKIVALIILVINVLFFVFSFFFGQLSPLGIMIRLSVLAVIAATYIGYNQRKIFGPICGIIVSALLILNFDLIDILIGIFYLVDNITLIKYLKD